MKIYTIYLSEDGLQTECYTNIKALYNGIMETGYINGGEQVGFYTESVKFNYANLVKKLKESTQNNKYYANVQILEGTETKIYIKEMQIKTK